MRDKKSLEGNFDAAFETIFRISTVFIKGSRNFVFIQCHQVDIFLDDLNNLISTFCVCSDGFQGLSKAFHYSVQILLLRNCLLILKCFLKPSLTFLLCAWLLMFSSVGTLIYCREKAQELICHRRLPV